MGQSTKVLVQHWPGSSPDDPPFYRGGEGAGDEVVQVFVLYKSLLSGALTKIASFLSKPF